MREAPAGIVGAFAANRPYLSIGVLAAGLVTMALVGSRVGAPGAGAVLARFVSDALIALGAPLLLAALSPRGPARRAIFGLGVLVLGGALLAARSILPAGDFVQHLPGGAPVSIALALFAALLVIGPFCANALRHSLLAPFAAVLGAAGGLGFLALEGFLDAPGGAAQLALGLALGLGVGYGVGAGFANRFAAGDPRRIAAAAAGHANVAIAAYGLMIMTACFALISFELNFGAVEWRYVWAGMTIASATMVSALVSVSGGLALSASSEVIAVDENRRRRWFAARWRPVRLALAPTTAVAMVAIVGIFVVIAAFESGLSDGFSVVGFILIAGLAAAIAFVSVRTSLMVMAMLAIAAILTDFALEIVTPLLGPMLSAPALPEKLPALALVSFALGQMTVSWRDAGERFRHARDVTENALNDGLRRYLFTMATGAAALALATYALGWDKGLAAVVYFLAAACIVLVIAPAAMTAMSARMSY